MKVIILGASGQDGFYLTKYLSSLNVDVVGISRQTGFHKLDYSNYNEIKNLLFKEKPTHVFHLAANSTINHEALFENLEIIDKTTVNLLEAIKEVSPATKLFLSGSALQFKNEGRPIDENTPFHASSPYAVSRINTTYMARYYREKFGLMIYIGYFFHHDSPLRSDKHINQIICNAVNKIDLGEQNTLLIGNMEVEKEFNFAGDFMRAVWILVNQESFFEAIIGSGKVHKIKDWIKTCFELKNLNYENYITIDTTFKTEFHRLISNPTIIKGLGWKPRYDLKDLANIMVNKKLDLY
jgi:GDPmannose 4,6-dehydratase